MQINTEQKIRYSFQIGQQKQHTKAETVICTFLGMFNSLAYQELMLKYTLNNTFIAIYRNDSIDAMNH